LSRRMAEAMGGQLHHEEAMGGGSRFSLTLPAQKAVPVLPPWLLQGGLIEDVILD
jgi:hypothetical protein